MEKEGQELAEKIGMQGQASFLRLDVADAQAWQQVTAEIEAQTGRLDILINNAGANVRHALTDTTREEWNRMLEVNLTGQFLGIQACAPLMRRSGGGSIVNLGSTAGIMGHPVAGYSTSKWGVRGLTKAAATAQRRVVVGRPSRITSRFQFKVTPTTSFLGLPIDGR